MKKVKILGSGCASCNQLVDAVKAVIAAEGIDASVEKVEDIQQIMAYNVISTPALVVDEVVVCKGRIPSREEIKEMLNEKAKGCCCGTHGSHEKKSGGCC
ncbi:thioredoxin family protein [Chlorobium sp. BLA1]|uniref:thioredoxin family protein n=1 Tax=Candidatus Chlorobium masyuteum TaxID=2716876 RepID=UPI001424788C|nr:thioredoxin family protein [Candidatus Chlorobium masyuteum]NHQ60733.1 thioredoxin family protein [Candidatus Chlorobium masyuteum]NTU45368.1 thioredoxin family protein [Chlorobiaceae bacterium]